MFKSASLMKNIFHTLSKVSFDTTLVNCSRITNCALLHYVYIFRNIGAMDQVPNLAGDN